MRATLGILSMIPAIEIFHIAIVQYSKLAAALALPKSTVFFWIAKDSNRDNATFVGAAIDEEWDIWLTE